MAFDAPANQQQVPALDCATEVGDCYFMPALPAPDVEQQPLAGGFGEVGQ